MTPGLRLDQGPPFAVPLAFFLTAPLFLAGAGIHAALSGPEWTATRWSPATLALTHLVTLGYLGMAMFGALTQMAPVAAGAAIPGVARIGRLGHGLLLGGVPPLAWGLATGAPWPLGLGALACALALVGLALGALSGLAKAPRGATRAGMAWALLALLANSALGTYLAGGLNGVWTLADAIGATQTHAGLGMIGWIGLLVVGSAYQVVPMLQITPNYPAWATGYLSHGLAGLLGAWVLARLAGAPDALVIALAGTLAVGLCAFAGLTLVLQGRRRRKRGDATLRYWRVAMLSLIGACLAGGGAYLWSGAGGERLVLLAGVLFLLGFAASVVNGMLLKIVPFLAWFHLNAQIGIRATGLANMQDFYPDRAQARQFGLHLGALCLLAASPWLPALALPGGILLAASALCLAGRLALAARLYRRHGGRFGVARETRANRA